MKKFIFGIALFTSALGFSSEFSCTSYLPGDNNWVEVGVTVNNNDILVSGNPDKAIIETIEIEMDGKQVNKCLRGPKKYDCMDSLTPGAAYENDSTKSIYSTLFMYHMAKVDKILSGVAYPELDFSKIARGRAYVAGYGGYYPNNGVYEYFDSEGKLLGRFLYNIVSLPCI